MLSSQPRQDISFPEAASPVENYGVNLLQAIHHFPYELSLMSSWGHSACCRVRSGVESGSHTSPRLVNKRSLGWVEARWLVGVSGILGIHVNPNHPLSNWKA